MWDWLRHHNERRRDYRRRMEVERDRRILGELATGVEHRKRRERRLIDEMRRIERALARANR